MRTTLDTRALESWLIAATGEHGLSLTDLHPAGTGFSAETLFATIRYPGTVRNVVVRVEQPGPQVFLDTDVAEQVATMAALRRAGFPAPNVLAYEDNPAVLGAPIVVMDRIHGRDFPQSPGYARSGWVKDMAPEQRAHLWREALSMLGRVGRTSAEPFRFLGRPRHGTAGLDQYLGWLVAWRHDTLGDTIHPLIDHGIAYLQQKRPHAPDLSFVWGDSNPCNMLFHDDLSVAAIMDFEAAALGPAEIDLGWWLLLDRSRVGDKPLSGVPNRNECIAIYEAALGRPARDVHYFELLAGVKMALVIARTVNRLISAGYLPPDNRAGFSNPVAALLARMLGIEGHEAGSDYHAYTVAAAGHHSKPPAYKANSTAI